MEQLNLGLSNGIDLPPVHVVALSGGKDSSCLALALAEHEPRDYQYIYTPTGDELPELFAHIDVLALRLGKPIQRLGIGKTLTQLIDDLGMLPNFNARWCTRMLKIEPAIEHMRSLPYGSRLYVGLRADEEERDGIYGDGVVSDFPFRRWGWGVVDVWAYLDKQRITVPRRTDCAQCYHQRIIEWFVLWRDYPDRYAAAVATEQRHGHTFRTPGRDTWPTALADLAADFQRGRTIKGADKYFAEKACRVCSL